MFHVSNRQTKYTYAVGIYLHTAVSMYIMFVMFHYLTVLVDGRIKRNG